MTGKETLTAKPHFYATSRLILDAKGMQINGVSMNGKTRPYTYEKDILTIDLSEDIKNVIDLEDISEAAIQSEIESYIITDGLAKEYSSFVSDYTSNIIETGVWLSGFYGSGKSYFGKLLGYMMSNRLISGTPARDRILQRFTGIDDEALVKNAIAKLNSINSRVVFMDIAKQDTSKGFAYALFRNFLKSLELPENEHGF